VAKAIELKYVKIVDNSFPTPKTDAILYRVWLKWEAGAYLFSLNCCFILSYYR